MFINVRNWMSEMLSNFGAKCRGVQTQAMALLKVIAVHLTVFGAKASELTYIRIEHIQEIGRCLTAKAKD